MAATNSSFSLDLDLLEKEIQQKEQDRREKAYSDLSGQIAGTKSTRPNNSNGVSNKNVGHGVEFNTLDEPVWDTISRDLKLVGEKFVQVLLPSSRNKNILRDWDLWGPLFICVGLSLILQESTSAKGPQFTQVFSLAFFGSCMVTLNMKLLGGKISFFQALCVIGYCLLPAVFSSFACKILTMMLGRESNIALLMRLLAVAVGCLWSIYASLAFLTGTLLDNRKLLGFYPVILFYFVVSWLVLSNS